jgi:ribosomal protein S18 acetylase RimI-like enzyme
MRTKSTRTDITTSVGRAGTAFELLDIPGALVRNWRDEDDYTRTLRVLHAAKAADGQEETRTLETWIEFLKGYREFELERDLKLVEVNGEVVAFNLVRWVQETGGDFAYNHHGHVLPEWRHRGIGRTMIREAERHLRELAGGHPAGSSKFLLTFVEAVQAGLIPLLEQEGYAPARYFYEMVRPDLADIPEASLPPGIEVRPVKPEHYRQIWDVDVQAFAEHWAEQVHTEQDYLSWQTEPRFQPELWQVAWRGEQIVGICLNWIDHVENEKYKRKRARTEDIGTLRPWRGRGIARALLAASLRQFRELGYAEAALDVDSENASGALGLYQRMGYRPAKTFIAYRKVLIWE